MSPELSPIVLFVYKRPLHARRTLAALQENKLASQSELFIFADGPKPLAGNADLEAIEETRRVIRGFPGFAKVTIEEAARNIGCRNSVLAGVTRIINKYGKAIILEDDMVTSSRFLDYMNDGLRLFESDQDIGTVHAYVPQELDLHDFPPYFLLSGADCWGWATWKDRWKDLVEDPLTVKRLLIEQDKVEVYEYGGGAMMRLLDDAAAGRVDAWDMQWSATQVLFNRKGIYPGKTFLVNIGLDGSGTHGDNSGIGVDTTGLSLSDYSTTLDAFKPWLRANQVALEKKFRRRYLSAFHPRKSFLLRCFLMAAALARPILRVKMNLKSP